MKRRDFIKTGAVWSGSLVAASSLSRFGSFANFTPTRTLNFGYYYPSEGTPGPLKSFVGLINENQKGISVGVHRCTDDSPAGVLKRLQSGELAGVFMLTNLISEEVSPLTLLSDGADAPSFVKLKSWFEQNEKPWDLALDAYGIKRIPFTHSGSRRGVWVNRSFAETQDLRGSNVYAEGLWGHLFRLQGANVSNHFSPNDSKDIYAPSNLFAAEKTGVAHRSLLHVMDERPFNESPGSTCDLYVNAKLWDELSSADRRAINATASAVGEGISKVWEKYDSSLFSLYKADRQKQFATLSLLENAELARQVRSEFVEKTACSHAQQLLNSYRLKFA